MYRCVGIQGLQFGTQRPAKTRRGTDTTVSDRTLVLSCEWLFTGPEGFAFGAKDFRPERRDDHAAPFYARLDTDPLVVRSVAVDQIGGLAD